MKEFLLNSACNGRRPRGIESGRRIERPRLMQKMLSERGVARFLVAPEGFGKTSLALQYAEEIIGLSRSWWVDASDPCFLRDLDNGRIGKAASAMAGESRLMVFEDVPYLDDARSLAFSKAVDALMSRGWEVVVTLCPFCDSFTEVQDDRVCLTPSDFLLDDAEISTVAPASEVRPSERVASLVWGGEKGFDRFIAGMRIPGMPAELELGLFVMLVLQDGAFEDIGMFAKTSKRDVCPLLSSHFPHAGMDRVEERFRACRLPIQRIVSAFGPQLDRMAAASAFPSKDVLIMRLARTLVHRGSHARACELAAAACGRRKRGLWLEECQDDLHAACALIEAEEVMESLGGHPVGLKASVFVASAMRAALLGDAPKAAALADRALSHSSAAPAQMAVAAMLCQVEPGSRRARRGAGYLAALGVASGPYSDIDTAVPALSAALSRGDENAAADVVRSCVGLIAGCDDAVYLLASALALPDRGVAGGESGRSRLVRFSGEVLGARTAVRAAPDLAEALLFSALSQTCDADCPTGRVPCLSASRIAGIDALLGRLETQRRVYRERSIARALPEASSASGPTHGDGGATDPAAAPASAQSVQALALPTPGGITVAGPVFSNERVPELYVRLFGGMEIWLGDRMIDPRSFAKQKAKTLLAILVLSSGQEVPRNRIVDIMWPTLVGDSALNNFYSMWSVLKRGLSLENGRCPYLVKQQGSCMLDRRYASSDVDRFDELCRRLLFERPDVREWSEIHRAMSVMYSGDLLPSEMKNEYIISMRTRYRSRLVDALVAAGNNLLDDGEPQAALWFVHSAMEHDDGREDVYRTLIRAQIMTGQRAAAIETYLLCRRVLSERYGMEVSQDTQALYDALVMAGA